MSSMNNYINDMNMDIDSLFKMTDDIRLINEEGAPSPKSNNSKQHSQEQQSEDNKESEDPKKKKRPRKLSPEEEAKRQEMEYERAKRLQVEAVLTAKMVANPPSDVNNQNVMTKLSINNNAPTSSQMIGMRPNDSFTKSAPDLSAKVMAGAQKMMSYSYMASMFTGGKINIIAEFMGIFTFLGSFVGLSNRENMPPIGKFVYKAVIGSHIENYTDPTYKTINSTQLNSIVNAVKSSGDKDALLNIQNQVKSGFTDLGNGLYKFNGNHEAYNIIMGQKDGAAEAFKSTVETRTNPDWFWRVVSYAVQVIVIGVVLYFLYRIVSKYIDSKVNRTKREQYSIMNRVPVNEITIPMLCTLDESTKHYYETMSILDENILTNFIGKILPTPKNIGKLIDKAAVGLLHLSNSTTEALRMKAIPSMLGTFANFLVSVGNLTLATAKTFLAGINNVVSSEKMSSHIPQ